MTPEKLIQTLKDTWHEILPVLPDNTFKYTLKSNDAYMVEYVTVRTSGSDLSYIIRLYGNYGSFRSDIIYELSYNTDTKYFSTITDNSIRIATWKEDLPRYYALRDDSNGKNGDGYTYIEWPCETDYFFQRMTVQNTLEYEQYKELDTECMVMQEYIKSTGHEAKSIALVLYDQDIELSSTEIIELIKEGINEQATAVSGDGITEFKGL
ncbi:hypothetical protein DQT32_04475 [Salmonella enterica subsp. enterica serovar Braenderup]|nr:hypothetical protein [Salmonella enterica subsp. enterica serovar Braenderup]